MELDIVMNNAERLDFIANCELADCAHSQTDHAALRGALNTSDMTDATDAPDQASGAVAGAALLGFIEGMSRQGREDVMDSFAFASLAANKAEPDGGGERWYKKFNEVLVNLGWVSFDLRYSQYRTTHQRFTMDKAALEIISSAITAAALPGPASVAMLKVAGDAIAALKAKDEPLRLFDRHTKMHKGGNFCVGSCMERDEGIIGVALAAVNFQASSNVTNVLFWEFSNAEVEVYRGEDYMVLLGSSYEDARQAIKDRLAERREAAILQYEI